MTTRVLLACTLLVLPVLASAFDAERDDVRAFIDEMVTKHQFDAESLAEILGQAESKEAILEAIARPAERTLTWPEYRQIFVRPEKITAGVEFWNEHARIIAAVSEATGVSETVLVGIVGVETNFGQITGNYRVLDALATLAFDYPPRAAFFRQQLGEFLLLTREEALDPSVPTGSYAGAMGRPQFMPGSYRAYAVDFDGDGQRDIWNNWQDVLGSVANYLVEHRWKSGEDVAAPADLQENWNGAIPENRLSTNTTVAALRQRGAGFETRLGDDQPAAVVTLDLGDDGVEHWVGFHNFFVITRYNRSVMYALAVLQMGRAVEEARAQ